MKTINYFSIVTGVALLTGCGVSGTALSDQSGTLEVSELKEVNEDASYYAFSTAVPINVLEANSGTLNFGIPLNFKYHGGRRGDLELNANYPLKLIDWDDAFQSEPMTDDVSKFQLKAVYSYPVFSYFKHEPEIHVSFGEIDNKRYYGVVPSRFLNSINIRGGISKEYMRNQTQYHNDYFRENYESLTLFTQGDAIVRQSMICFKLGASFQKFINLVLEGTGDNKNFAGHLVSLESFYFDVNYLLMATADKVHVRYTAVDPATNQAISHDGAYDLTRLLPKRSLGFDLGYELQTFSGKKHNFVNAQMVEIGFYPGYYDSFLKSFYLKYVMRLGLGKASR